MTSVRKPAGSIRALTVRGIPFFVHWSLPLGGLVCAAVVLFHFPETLYLCAAYACLLIVHELGHALAARATGVHVHSIEVSGVGGRCRFDFPRSRKAALWTASGGLVAQAILFVATAIVLYASWPVESIAVQCFAAVFTLANAVIFLANVVPARLKGGLATDGFLLWALVRQALRGDPYRYPDTSVMFATGTQLTSLARFTPAGFRTGVEVLNDNSTPMDFVVATFVQHLGFSREEAMRTMLAIHRDGGILVALPSLDAAKTAAEGIVSHARASGFGLRCRAVEIEPDLPRDRAPE